MTLADGREIVLSGNREVGRGNREISMDDRRTAGCRSPGTPSIASTLPPAAAAPPTGLPAGAPAHGQRQHARRPPPARRLVYDLDESETTETLDGPSRGADHTIPFGLIASIGPPGRDERDAPYARVTLHDGEELQLERSGDLGDGNVGMLIFVSGYQRPEYVPWTDVERVDFDRPAGDVPAARRSQGHGHSANSY